MLPYQYYYLTRELYFGSKHARLFGLGLYSPLKDFQDFFDSKSFKYQKLEKNGVIRELILDKGVTFISSKSQNLNLVIGSDDGVRASYFYFYTEYDRSTDFANNPAVKNLHDFFIKDDRVTLKDRKSDKKEQHFVRDYLSPLEAARIEKRGSKLSVTIVSAEEYKKLPKYRWPSIKASWLLWPAIALVYLGPAVAGLFFGNNDQEEISPLMSQPDTSIIVYICTGPQAKSYHIDVNCYGLQSCSADVEEIAIEEAQDYQRTPCHYCCK